MLLSHYTDGGRTIVYECAVCHEIVAEYTCDEDGVPVDRIFDYEQEHECFLNEDPD